MWYAQPQIFFAANQPKKFVDFGYPVLKKILNCCFQTVANTHDKSDKYEDVINAWMLKPSIYHCQPNNTPYLTTTFLTPNKLWYSSMLKHKYTALSWRTERDQHMNIESE